MRTAVAIISGTSEGIQRRFVINVEDNDGYWDDIGDVQFRNLVSRFFLDCMDEASQYVADKLLKKVELNSLEEIEVKTDLPGDLFL